MGFKINVRSAQEVSENWGMFNLDSKISVVDKMIILPLVTYRTQERKPLEKVIFIRDEISNKVWAIENIVPDLFEGGIDASIYFRMLVNYLKEKYPEPVNAQDLQTTDKYQFISSTPKLDTFYTSKLCRRSNTPKLNVSER